MNASSHATLPCWQIWQDKSFNVNLDTTLDQSVACHLLTLHPQSSASFFRLRVMRGKTNKLKRFDIPEQHYGEQSASGWVGAGAHRGWKTFFFAYQKKTTKNGCFFVYHTYSLRKSSSTRAHVVRVRGTCAMGATPQPRKGERSQGTRLRFRL